MRLNYGIIDNFEELPINPERSREIQQVLFGEYLPREDLSEGIQIEISNLSSLVANISSGKFETHHSILRAPVDILLSSIDMNGKKLNLPFFFMFDEFENLLDYQQKVINTLLKHMSGNAYVKIGVRPVPRPIPSPT